MNTGNLERNRKYRAEHRDDPKYKKRINQRAQEYRDRNRNNPKYRERVRESNKESYQRNKDRRLKYKGRYISITRRKTGVCNLCRAIKGIDCKQTQWHHLEYNDSSKEQYIIEVCPPCHIAQTQSKLSKERLSEIGRIARSHTPPEALIKAGKAGIAASYAKYGRKDMARRQDAGRVLVYNRWTGQLQKRRTFKKVSQAKALSLDAFMLEPIYVRKEKDNVL